MKSTQWADPIKRAAAAQRMLEAHFQNRTPLKLERLKAEKEIVCLDEVTIGQDNQYRWQHVCGEIFVRSFKRLSGIYCPTCHVSKGQGELYEFIRHNYESRIIVRDRNQIWPRTIDIYLPAIKLGFEFHGKYWQRADGIREAEKVFEAGEVGIRLINLWENDWTSRRGGVQAGVLHEINLKLGRGSSQT